MHRNSTNNGLIVTPGNEHASSSTDTFGFGYGRTMALMIRYDTRVRIHASYGCTIRIGYEESTLTGGKFFHGGVSLKAEADCGPGSYVDLIPEDWRLLTSGKKRLVFDHTCGIIPLCSDPPTPTSPPPAVPAPRTPPPAPSPVPSPPPFPPGTINLPPFGPKIAAPGSGDDGRMKWVILALCVAAILAFAFLQLYFMIWFRISASAARIQMQQSIIPVAKIEENGSSSVVMGRRVDFERQSLLSEQNY